MEQLSTKQLKKETKYLTILIWVAFLFMIVCRVITIFVMDQTSTVTGADIDRVFELYEANPFAKMLGTINGIYVMILHMLLPGFVMAMYYFLRLKLYKGKIDLETLALFTLMIFFTMILNLLNDATILISRLV